MVRARHEEIQKIEKDFFELAQMFQDLDALVVQQEAPVAQIDERGEEAASNMVKGNVEIGQAIDKARARNRKKWWCLLISSKYSKATQVVAVLTIVLSHYHHYHRGCRCRRRCCHEAVVDMNSWMCS